MRCGLAPTLISGLATVKPLLAALRSMIETVPAAVRLALATSSRPSPLKSAAASPRLWPLVVVSPSLVKPGPGLRRNNQTESVARLPKARSVCPSPVKSPATIDAAAVTPNGAPSAAKLPAGLRKNTDPLPPGEFS